MTSIWLNADHVSIKCYGATVKGSKAVVKIELEVTDHGDLGFLLDNLGRAQEEIWKARKAKAAKAPPAPKPRAIERQVLLALPYHGGDK